MHAPAWVESQNNPHPNTTGPFWGEEPCSIALGYSLFRCPLAPRDLCAERRESTFLTKFHLVIKWTQFEEKNWDSRSRWQEGRGEGAKNSCLCLCHISLLLAGALGHFIIYLKCVWWGAKFIDPVIISATPWGWGLYFGQWLSQSDSQHHLQPQRLSVPTSVSRFWHKVKGFFSSSCSPSTGWFQFLFLKFPCTNTPRTRLYSVSVGQDDSSQFPGLFWLKLPLPSSKGDAYLKCKKGIFKT